MQWSKKGVIFAPENNREWMTSHASIPVPDRINDCILRIYFGTRDPRGRSHIGFVDVEAGHPQKIIGISEQPVLPLGRPGTFDDSGIMPSWIINHRGKKYLFYIGWNQEVTVSYRLAIGVAMGKHGSGSFSKFSEGPICDRSLNEPFFNTAPCVLISQGAWRMWYISCTGWDVVGGWPEPHYHVKYADSNDGINWRKTGRICIDYDEFTAAIGRPCVFVEKGLYKMFYSYRGVKDYRVDPKQSYRLGYAESKDGLNWTRKDDIVGIGRSESGWDSEMIEYCSVYRHAGQTFMLYNGNGFGRTGFGYAILE
jgi:hypothetical protein